ncbi:MAG TPA: aldo/keto reductase, partial [Acidobacteriota bacterium]|nr:aldo/keto reductase [Acidobacteriota bacterium]
MTSLRRLGASDLMVSPIGLGCWQFSQGQGFGGKFWGTMTDEEILAVVRISLDGGINWFDTAEAYGRGASERALARALKALGKAPGEVVVATKWHPLFRTARSIPKTIGARIENLGGYPIDLFQVHSPLSFSSIKAQMTAMARLVEEGKIRTIGVSNFSARQMRKAQAALARRGLRLASNQVRYSLLDRAIETNGVLDAAKELGISIIAYSPLAQGILSGKFHADPSLILRKPGYRRYLGPFKPRGLERSRPLIEALRDVAAKHGATSSQVALNWVAAVHGDSVVAIPGASSPAQAEENAGALKFSLAREDVELLDRVSRPLMS